MALIPIKTAIKNNVVSSIKGIGSAAGVRVYKDMPYYGSLFPVVNVTTAVKNTTLPDTETASYKLSGIDGFDIAIAIELVNKTNDGAVETLELMEAQIASKLNEDDTLSGIVCGIDHISSEMTCEYNADINMTMIRMLYCARVVTDRGNYLVEI